ncbi:methionine--tRNA ligase, mitochondrial-like isoform X2 [Halichondria panicea]|uniref:methionine--tRNA ligase, mitochondrial-like isoform X2 n=1 Tax=Halichondria panicea TaxID=6063 RepID=UPI00312B419F
MARCLQQLRQFQTSSIDFHSFITTPIFYVNADPHIGHLYTALLADAAHRWQLVKGVGPAVFSTGTDEHGLKVQKAAAVQGCPPNELCDRISQRFKTLFRSANISFTDYIRTTESRHITRVEAFWEDLHRKGHMYKGSYEGWYSVPDETFLSSSQIVDGPEPGSKVSLESGHTLEWSSEENYMFRLTDFREKLLQWINTKPYPIVPEVAHHQVHQYLLDLSSDLSVSRPRSRLQWGVPVPGDNTQTMSKSTGNVVDPFLQIEKYGVDSLRYFLLKEGTLQQDGDYSEKRVVSLLNSDLADTLGNLVQRVTAKKLHASKKSSISQAQWRAAWCLVSGAEDFVLLERLRKLSESVAEHYENFEFNKGIMKVMNCLHQTNQFLERHEPWKLVKDPTKQEHLQTVLGVAIESIRLCSCLLYPIIPQSATAVLQRIGVVGSAVNWSPCVSDIECRLTSQDRIEHLYVATQSMVLGNTPLFKKIS